jgi:glucose-6-phosphate 1-epimerase
VRVISDKCILAFSMPRSSAVEKVADPEGPSEKLVLVCRSGNRASSCEVFLFGAHIRSWVTSTDTEDEAAQQHLWFSKSSVNDGSAPLRGGIPIAFPQFADAGGLNLHGFARTQMWSVAMIDTPIMLSDESASAADDDEISATVVLELRDSERTRRLWDHSFLLRYRIRLDLQSLLITLDVENTSPDNSFAFSGCFHPYFHTRDITSVSLNGLEECDYIDKVDRRILKKQTAAALIVGAEVETANAEGFTRDAYFIDRIYYSKCDVLHLIDHAAGLSYHIEKSSSWPHWVAFNPWQEGKRGPQHPDFDDDGYKYMLCVEAAIGTIDSQITLQPHASWSGFQRMSINRM